MRFRMLNRMMKALVTTTAVATTFTVFAAPAAHAATTVSVVNNPVWVYGCEAILYGNSSVQASAGVYMSQNAAKTDTHECIGWLDRSPDGVNNWQTVSSRHTLSVPGTSDYTGWYYDSAPYQAMACVEQLPSEVVACTDPW